MNHGVSLTENQESASRVHTLMHSQDTSGVRAQCSVCTVQYRACRVQNNVYTSSQFTGILTTPHPGPHPILGH